MIAVDADSGKHLKSPVDPFRICQSGSRQLTGHTKRRGVSTDFSNPMKRSDASLSGVQDVRAVEAQWWVAHVKPSQEKRLAGELADAGVVFCLPLVQRNSLTFGVKKKVYSPLIPGYLYFAGGAMERHEVILTHRTVGIINVCDQKAFIGQLRDLQKTIEYNPFVGLWNKTPVGKRARVVHGKPEGVEGFVESIRERPDKVRLIVRFNMMGQSVAVELDADQVELMDD